MFINVFVLKEVQLIRLEDSMSCYSYGYDFPVY